MLGSNVARGGVRRGAVAPLHRDILPALTVALLAGSLAETILLRLVTRVGVHIPRGELVTDALEGASLLGSFAFNFASILAMALAALVLSAFVASTRSAPGRALLAGISAAVAFGLLGSLLALGPSSDAVFGLASALLVAFVGLAIAAERQPNGWARTALALVVGSYVCYQYYTLSHLLFETMGYGVVPPASVPVLRAGEVMAVAAAFAAFLAWGRPRWRSAGVAGFAGVGLVLSILTLAALSPASTASILALWTTGISVLLPAPLYLIALGLYLITVVACWRSGNAFWPAAGLLLVLLAGYMAESTYHHLLLLLGVAFLSGAIDPRPGENASGASGAI